MGDPVVDQLREQITSIDRALFEAINKRLELVTQMRRYKERHHLPFLDPAREEWMFRHLTQANRGPLSAKGLAEIYTLVLDISKRETTEDAVEPAQAR